jgi:rubrerythrin
LVTRRPAVKALGSIHRKGQQFVDSTDLGATPATSRRSLIGLLGLGGALATLPVVTRTAAAQEGGDQPKRPTPADLDLLRFAQTVELSASEAYAALVARTDLDDSQRTVLETFHEHHVAYAQALAGLIGRSAPGSANSTLSGAIADGFNADSLDEALLSAHDLERDAVATHTELLGMLDGIDGATLVASIIPAEARHSAALAGLLGVAVEDQVSPPDATPLSPDDFPVE